MSAISKKVYQVRIGDHGRIYTTGRELDVRRRELALEFIGQDVATTGWVETPDGRQLCDLIIESDGQTGFAVVDDDPAGRSRISEAFRTSLLRLARLIRQQIVLSEAPTADSRISIKTQFLEPQLRMMSPDEAMPLQWHGVRNFTRTVLMGDPGAGKTTSLRRLAFELLSDIDWDDVPSVPCYIALRDFADRELSLDASLRTSWGSNSVPQDLHNIGVKVVFLFDGLDEVPMLEQSRLVEQIRNIEASSPSSSIFVSCRSASYRGWFDDFARIEIGAWSPRQITHWAKNYFVSRHCEGLFGNFLDAMFSNPSTVAMCSNPLMLNIASRAFVREGVLPLAHGQLASRWADGPLEEWDRSRGVTRIYRDDPSLHSQRLTLYTLALAIAGNDTGTMSALDLVKSRSWSLPEAEVRLDLLVHTTGLLARDVDGRVRFRHQVFEEYLLADWLVRNTESASQVLHRQLSPEWWRRVLPIAIRLATEPGELVKVLRDSFSPEQWDWESIALFAEIFAEPSTLSVADESEFLSAMRDALSSHLSGSKEIRFRSSDIKYAGAPYLPVVDEHADIGSWRCWLVQVDRIHLDLALLALQTLASSTNVRLHDVFSSLAEEGATSHGHELLMSMAQAERVVVIPGPDSSTRSLLIACRLSEHVGSV